MNKNDPLYPFSRADYDPQINLFKGDHPLLEALGAPWKEPDAAIAQIFRRTTAVKQVIRKS